MNDYKISFQKTVTVKNPHCRLLRYTSATLSGPGWHSVGIDPGVNFGLTILDGNSLSIYHGTLKKETKPGMYGYAAFLFLQDMLDNVPPIEPSLCVIEGAAYNKTFGQVGLAEVRIGFFLQACLHYKIDVATVIPPATIRKTVFQDYRKQAGDVWPILHHNAADSLSMALYEMSMRDGKKRFPSISK